MLKQSSKANTCNRIPTRPPLVHYILTSLNGDENASLRSTQLHKTILTFLITASRPNRSDAVLLFIVADLGIYMEKSREMHLLWERAHVGAWSEKKNVRTFDLWPLTHCLWKRQTQNRTAINFTLYLGFDYRATRSVRGE